MKTIVRAFVVALALTGFAASTQISKPANNSKVLISKVSAAPVPSCYPDGKNDCGMSQW